MPCACLCLCSFTVCEGVAALPSGTLAITATLLRAAASASRASRFSSFCKQVAQQSAMSVRLRAISHACQPEARPHPAHRAGTTLGPAMNAQYSRCRELSSQRRCSAISHGEIAQHEGAVRSPTTVQASRQHFCCTPGPHLLGMPGVTPLEVQLNPYSQQLWSSEQHAGQNQECLQQQ